MNDKESQHFQLTKEQEQPLLPKEKNIFEIDIKLEMGELSSMFFHRIGQFIYYVTICVYLYGGMATYAIIVSKSIAAIVCGGNETMNGNKAPPCDNIEGMDLKQAYYVALSVFTLTLCPFVFFNMSKTKFLQVLTTIILWLAFITMIILGGLRIVNGNGFNFPVAYNFKELPAFFGVGVASLMCQHCLPSIVTPVRKKRQMKYVLFGDIMSVTILNFLTCMTAVFAFPECQIEDLYTLNFASPMFLKYVLRVFPILTISTNVPIIGITLRENLVSLFLSGSEDKKTDFILRKCVFPMATVIPPIIIAFCTYDIELLVGITGAYPGAILQYVIPAGLLFIARKTLKKIEEKHCVGENVYRSPFSSNFWIYFILCWYGVSLAAVCIRFMFSSY